MKAHELLSQFIEEALECLEHVGDALLQLEREPQNPAALNNLFRLVHTLKGNCGLFDFKPLELLLHAAEDVLDQVRQTRVTYSHDLAEDVLSAMDFAADMVDDIVRTGAVPLARMEQATAMALQLRVHVQAPGSEQVPSVGSGQPEADGIPAAPAWVQHIPAEMLQSHRGAMAWCYTPESGCFFKGEDPWLYACQAPGLLHVQVVAAQPWPDDLREWDCYQCNLQVVGLSDARVDALEEHFRYVPEQVTFCAVSALPSTMVAGDEEAAASDAMVSAAVPAPLRAAAHQLWIDQQALLAMPQVTAGTVQAVRQVYLGILRCLADAPAQALAQELQQWPSPLPAADLLAWAQAHAPWGAAVVEEVTSPSMTSTPMPVQPAVQSEEPGAVHKQLKVSQEKVDRLMDLIGEMVVAKNALPYLAERAEAVFQQRELAREIKAQYAVINRIAEDMQHAIMQVRMLPVGAVFQRFTRLVRDTSKKLGKEVDLRIEGESTEADKNVIEALADPLIHILRNSLDHGIELPAVREAAGKARRGSITVRARQASDRVIIEITDDGAGVDAQRVRRKAVDQGLIPADKAHQLSDAEAIQLIFLPGFSTAEHISDLSGRGVGMDVVRAAVERINGHVALSSQHGQGTHIQLSLPLSMAITNVMVVQAGGRRFGVPMDHIVETVRVHGDDVHRFKHHQTTVLRGKVVPLQALHDLLDLGCAPQVNSDQELAVLVVRLGAEHVGFMVDQFHGVSDIILKPLEGVLAGLRGYAGTALMGDGSVLMVLNPKELC